MVVKNFFMDVRASGGGAQGWGRIFPTASATETKGRGRLHCVG